MTKRYITEAKRMGMESQPPYSAMFLSEMPKMAKTGKQPEGPLEQLLLLKQIFTIHKGELRMQTGEWKRYFGEIDRSSVPDHHIPRHERKEDFLDYHHGIL